MEVSTPRHDPQHLHEQPLIPNSFRCMTKKKRRKRREEGGRKEHEKVLEKDGVVDGERYT